ncbi:hypothetical protein AWW66_08845 [Micromonospora rosaria]|uniref:RNA polymerase sigma-70 region 2 domain-containing protein n=1 Tax=Micromonospora rosaria TaxID=47874 RepID=A0A136PVG1_9ACTN|nr:sigma-70 family RNA polymerase sigma factor [Micromonospora rosaria]KXK62327.1 hypothetical protein AWW66_08845 [Micromonospora rosaria]
MGTAAQDNRALVEAVRRGDRVGLEGMYRRYADRLYTYARVMVREPEAAADAVHDAFLTASQRIDQLRDPDRLRPWLYAIVRSECLRHLRERARAAPLEEADEPVAETADPASGVNAEQVRALVHAAADALNPGDREVVHLAIRHDLSSAEIGAALGVPANHAHARLSRARAQLERALGALLVARSEGRDCPILADLLDGWQGRLTPLLRKRVSRHIDGCAVCGLLRRDQLSPAALLSAYTAPGFLVVAESVWPRLAGTDAAVDPVPDAAGPVPDAAGPVPDAAGPVPDGRDTVDPLAADPVAGPTGGRTGIEPPAEAATAPSSSAEPVGPPDGTAPSGPTAESKDGQAAELNDHPGDGPPGPEDGATAGPGGGAEGGPAAQGGGTVEAHGAGNAAAVAAGTDDRSVAAVTTDGPTDRRAPRPVRATAAATTTGPATRGDRRRRRVAATAGLLVLLALAGTWAIGPGRPTAEQVPATSGTPAGEPVARSATPPETGPAAGPMDRTEPAPGPTDASGTPAVPGPPPGTVPSDAAPVPPGPRPDGDGPAAEPRPTAVPTTRPGTPRPTAPRPTATPQLAAAFTVTARAHVRCGAETYSLVVQATGSAAIGDAQVRWTPAGGAPSSQAMTVDGSSARATVGRLRASTVTWTVRATATDGRSAQSPSYTITDPCVRPG